MTRTGRDSAKPLVATSAHERALTYAAAALLLGYPDDDLVGQLPVLRRALAGLPEGVRTPLLALTSHLTAGSRGQLAADYVATFDLKRRCCLYLTYYVYGDTRKRGMALLGFKDAYRDAGLELTDDELPDHLSVVLEFAATGDPEAGAALLAANRTGLELLRLALESEGSPYHGAVDAVCLTLPALPARDRETVLTLAREGPPGEEVGLDPYREAFAPPEYMPTPSSSLRAAR